MEMGFYYLSLWFFSLNLFLFFSTVPLSVQFYMSFAFRQFYSCNPVSVSVTLSVFLSSILSVFLTISRLWFYQNPKILYRTLSVTLSIFNGVSVSFCNHASASICNPVFVLSVLCFYLRFSVCFFLKHCVSFCISISNPVHVPFCLYVSILSYSFNCRCLCFYL
jgi:hypothetical protein